jgi:hypothetical protein
MVQLQRAGPSLALGCGSEGTALLSVCEEYAPIAGETGDIAHW